MSQDEEAVHLVVHGRVQGVWFRECCRQEAERHQVRGWVTNREDGTVEAVLAGPAEAVQAVVAWARTGPPRARVERVDTEAVAPPDLRGFEVR